MNQADENKAFKNFTAQHAKGTENDFSRGFMRIFTGNF